MLKDRGSLDIERFKEVVFNGDTLQVDQTVVDRVTKSFEFLKEFSENKIIYGVNTGFGPMAQYKIQDSERNQLQYNLIRSHASGTGNSIDPRCVYQVWLILNLHV